MLGLLHSIQLYLYLQQVYLRNDHSHCIPSEPDIDNLDVDSVDGDNVDGDKLGLVSDTIGLKHFGV